MSYSKTKLREHESIAREACTPEHAFQLWWNSNWTWYDLCRQSLLNALREDREKISLSNIQFIYFIQTHIRPHFEEVMSDEEVFMTEPDPYLAEDLADHFAR